MIADELKDAFIAVSPFIQKHTSVVCPHCEKVCCINKHGDPDENDLVFLSKLGIDLQGYVSDRKDTDPCRFLAEKGCSLERWMRPFRCTWFFCEPLLKSISEDNARAYREFVGSLRRLVLIRQKLIEDNGA